MSENTQSAPTILKFVKVKSWYIPADGETYQVLRGLKIPMVKIHQDFLPTLNLVLKPRGIRAKSTPFREVYDDHMARIGLIWNGQPGRKCRIDDSRAEFRCELNDKNKKAVSRLDNILTKFCATWAMRYSPSYSESNGRIKFVADYRFDPDLNPVVPTSTREDTAQFDIVLGFTRITLTFTQKHAKAVPYNLLTISTKAGSDWVQVHTSSFTNNDIGDIKPWLSAMNLLHSQVKIHE